MLTSVVSDVIRLSISVFGSTLTLGVTLSHLCHSATPRHTITLCHICVTRSPWFVSEHLRHSITPCITPLRHRCNKLAVTFVKLTRLATCRATRCHDRCAAPRRNSQSREFGTKYCTRQNCHYLRDRLREFPSKITLKDRSIKASVPKSDVSIEHRLVSDTERHEPQV